MSEVTRLDHITREVKTYFDFFLLTVDCPAEDGWICGRDWPLSFCDIYSNVKEECPNMCGICSGTSIDWLQSFKQYIINVSYQIIVAN